MDDDARLGARISWTPAAPPDGRTLVGRDVRVHMPGGTAHVTLTDATILLGGPTTSIGLIEYPWPVPEPAA